ncbi:MAG: hypothetical protein R2787_10655 [Saprospiraceae bacterium]
MIDNIARIQQTLQEIFQAHTPPLQLRQAGPGGMEFAGTIPTMQGKQKVDGIYFASIVPKPKDVRLYFFPIYTHASQFTGISASLRKCLKGKSCFHIKALDDEMTRDIQDMVQTGVRLYQEDGIV